MDNYITGTTIKRLREGKGLTQNELAAQIDVSPKTVSKWETARGLPDISLLEPLCAALDVSVSELVSGLPVTNKNTSGNMLRSKFYVCPVCGNVIHTLGEAAISCCGVTLPPLEAEDADEDHEITVSRVEDDYFVSISHEMTKQHYISFLAHVTWERVQIVKLYPEGAAECRFPARGRGFLYAYCNHHGFMRKKL